MTPSRTTPEIAALTNIDWSAVVFRCSDDGSVSFSFGSSALTPLMMSSVEAEPLFSTVISTRAAAVHAHDVALRRESVANMATSRI